MGCKGNCVTCRDCIVARSGLFRVPTTQIMYIVPIKSSPNIHPCRLWIFLRKQKYSTDRPEFPASRSQLELRSSCPLKQADGCSFLGVPILPFTKQCLVL